MRACNADANFASEQKRSLAVERQIDETRCRSHWSESQVSLRQSTSANWATNSRNREPNERSTTTQRPRTCVDECVQFELYVHTHVHTHMSQQETVTRCAYPYQPSRHERVIRIELRPSIIGTAPLEREKGPSLYKVSFGSDEEPENDIRDGNERQATTAKLRIGIFDSSRRLSWIFLCLLVTPLPFEDHSRDICDGFPPRERERQSERLPFPCSRNVANVIIADVLIRSKGNHLVCRSFDSIGYSIYRSLPIRIRYFGIDPRISLREHSVEIKWYDRTCA